MKSRSVSSGSLWPHGLHSAWNSPGQNTGVGSCSLLQGTFPTRGLNQGLPHCRWILYRLSYQGTPRLLEWVDCPFSSRSFWPRNRTNQSLLHCRWILYQLSYQKSPRTVQFKKVADVKLFSTISRYFLFWEGTNQHLGT